MKLEERKDGSIMVLSVTGRVDGLTAPDLEKRIGAIVDLGHRNVLIDCENMEYISSAGLRALLIGARKCEQAGGKMALSALQPNPNSVLKESGINTIIECFDSSRAAIAVAF